MLTELGDGNERSFWAFKMATDSQSVGRAFVSASNGTRPFGRVHADPRPPAPEAGGLPVIALR